MFKYLSKPVNFTKSRLHLTVRPFISLQFPTKRLLSTMSQEQDNLLLIPGPIVVSEAVRTAQSIQSLAHTSPEFIAIFQKVLKDLRVLFKSNNPNDQALVISGSGTLGWDITGSNLIYPGENVLLLSTGFFSDRFTDALNVYGAKVDVITAPIGEAVPLEELSKALDSKKYSAVVFTHVDTSTAVLNDCGAISEIVKQKSPESLIIVDGVCSVGVEDIEFSKWGLDFVLSASQKAIGVQSGLSINFISERAIKKATDRPVQSSYYASLKNWLPIIKNYEAGKPSYFATPAIQSLNALKVSLEEILAQDISVRYNKNQEVSNSFKSRLQNELGLKLVTNDKYYANGLTAAYFPEGIQGGEFLSKVYSKKVVLAGGIHNAIKSKYFRIGHMGVSALDESLGHLETCFTVIKESLEELGYKY